MRVDGCVQTKKDVYLTMKWHFQRVIREENDKVWNKFAVKLEEDGNGNNKLLFKMERLSKNLQRAQEKWNQEMGS